MVQVPAFDWAAYYTIAFERAKTSFAERYPGEDERELPPHILGLKGFVDSLPCPVKILEVEVDTAKHEQMDPVCQLLVYDFGKLGEHSVSLCGRIASNDTKGFEHFLEHEFGLTPAPALTESFCRDLSTSYFSDTDKPNVHFHFPRYDIRPKPDQYVGDLLELMSWAPLDPEVARRFWPTMVDYNALYQLPRDPIIPMSEIIQKDPTFEGFVKLASGRSAGISIEDLQEHVSDIQLIPQVPEAVKRVFQVAKALYVFGYFRYTFFTVSAHYGYLALESAIKSRYAVSLGTEAILSNSKGEQYRMRLPSWERIDAFCRRNRKQGWPAHKLTVNGAHFPTSMDRLLKWLVDNKIVPGWERQYFNAGVHLRNSLSHLESPPVFMPSSEALKTMAEKINKLFASL